MTARNSVGSSVVLAFVLAGAAIAVWRWRVHVFGLERLEIDEETWEQVKEKYPLPQSPETVPLLSEELMERVVSSYPFSPARRLTNAPIEPLPGETSGSSEKAATPQFVFKGRIDMGQRKRAILEDTAEGKTYFLEVGQEVAGFKVLDMTENQVILSDSHTNQEIIVSLAAEDSKSE
jgi:hypothetical protein